MNIKNSSKIKLISLFLILSLLIVGLAGCKSDEPKEDVSEEVEDVTEDGEEDDSEEAEDSEIVVEDDFGKSYTITGEEEKIVSLAPSLTEILFAVGLDDEIVGVTSYCDYPEEALEKEEIGSFMDVNLEKIIELEPDLVVAQGQGDPEDVERLEEAGISVLSFDPNTIEEITEVIEKIGLVMGKADEAKELAEDMLAKKDEIVEKVKDEDTVTVFYEIWHDPLQAAGPGSFMDNIIELANGENIAKDADSPYPEFDLEQLVERDPEFYLTTEDMEEKTIESIKERPGYEGITAIKEDNIFLLDANITSRPGPRVIEALEMVAEILHPEAFN